MDEDVFLSIAVSLIFLQRYFQIFSFRTKINYKLEIKICLKATIGQGGGGGGGGSGGQHGLRWTTYSSVRIDCICSH